jgi:hypothetical protein
VMAGGVGARDKRLISVARIDSSAYGTRPTLMM